MAKYLRSLTLEVPRDLVEFVNGWLPVSSNLVPDLLFRSLGRYETGGIEKIALSLTSNCPETPEPRGMGDVAIAIVSIEPGNLKTLPTEARLPVLVDLCVDALVRVAEHFRWSCRPWIVAREKVVANNFSFNGKVGRSVSSPDRKRLAHLSLQYTRRIAVSLVVAGADGAIACALEFALLPASMDIFEGTIGQVKWLSSTRIEVRHVNRKDFWVFDVEGCSVDFHFARAERGDAHGQYDLGTMYRDGRLLPADPKLAEYWLKESAKQGYKRAQQALQRFGSEV